MSFCKLLGVEKWPKYCPNLDRPQPTLTQIQQKNNIWDLGLLTPIIGKSASRRFVWYLNQLLTLKISQEMADLRFYLARLLPENIDLR